MPVPQVRVRVTLLAPLGDAAKQALIGKIARRMRRMGRARLLSVETDPESLRDALEASGLEYGELFPLEDV